VPKLPRGDLKKGIITPLIRPSKPKNDGKKFVRKFANNLSELSLKFGAKYFC
jgi:hypothetical protein